MQAFRQPPAEVASQLLLSCPGGDSFFSRFVQAPRLRKHFVGDRMQKKVL